MKQRVLKKKSKRLLTDGRRWVKHYRGRHDRWWHTVMLLQFVDEIRIAHEVSNSPANFMAWVDGKRLDLRAETGR